LLPQKPEKSFARLFFFKPQIYAFTFGTAFLEEFLKPKFRCVCPDLKVPQT
jgi:hypothetical protein